MRPERAFLAYKEPSKSIALNFREFSNKIEAKISS
jgi:hypothetical protein